MSATDQHIFFGHLLRPYSTIPGERTLSGEIWPSVFLLLCLTLITVIKARSSGRMIRILREAFQPAGPLREEGINMRLHLLALNCLFAVNTGFVLYKINTLYPLILSTSGSLVQFLFFSAVVVLVIALRQLVNRVIAHLAGAGRIVGEYLSSIFQVNQAFGLLLFPAVALTELSNHYQQFFIWLSALILAASFLIKWYRGLATGLISHQIGLLQIFSYFCGLEILPLLVLVKYLIQTL